MIIDLESELVDFTHYLRVHLTRNVRVSFNRLERKHLIGNN